MFSNRNVQNQTTTGMNEFWNLPYLIDDASPANSETTLMSTFFDSVYFDSVDVASVVACAVLVLLPLLLLLLLLHSTVVVLIRMPILLPLPSSRCSFGEWFDDGAIVGFDLTVHADVLSVVSCLSSVELDSDAASDADADAVAGGLPTVAIASVFCVPLAFTIWPCSNDAATATGGTLFTNDMLCVKLMKRKRGREKKRKRRTIQNYQWEFILYTFYSDINLLGICNWNFMPLVICRSFFFQ